MKDKEKYCLKCGHRNNHTYRGHSLRCRKCGAKMPYWDRETNSYIL